MWIVPVVFASIVALIVGAYWLFVIQPEAKLLGRLATARSVPKTVRGFFKPEERLSSVDPINAMLARSSAVTGPLNSLITQSGLKLTVGTFILATGCAALGGYALIVFFTHKLALGLIVGAAASLLPYLYVRRVRNARMYKFEEQFPESIDLIGRALRAGHALPTGLSMVADEMPAPVGAEFRTLYDEQNFGLTLPEALRNFAARVPVLDARFFVTAVMTQREAGGNLAEVLDNLASVIRDRFKVKRQIRVISAHGRITGWILAGLPPSVAAAAFVLSPSHLQTLLGDPLGIRMIETAIGMQLLGTLIIRKIVNIEY
jgi:tight adherence protein B